MSQTTTKTARTIIYLCCIGGLLIFTSYVVVFVHTSFSNSASTRQLSFLEGAGVSAFIYVVVFAVRYGVRSNTSLFAPKTKSASSPQCTSNTNAQRVSKLTAEQKSALKAELISSCGCTDITRNSGV